MRVYLLIKYKAAILRAGQKKKIEILKKSQDFFWVRISLKKKVKIESETKVKVNYFSF